MASLSSENLSSNMDVLDDTPSRDVGSDELRAQKTLAILNDKDYKIKELQTRLRYLEKLARKLDYNEDKPVSDVITSPEKLPNEEGLENCSEMVKSIEQFCLNTPSAEDPTIKIYNSPSPQYDSNLSNFATGDWKNLVNRHQLFKDDELYEAIAHEKALRTQDRKKFCKILDTFHLMLRSVKICIESQSQINLSSLYENKEEDLSQSLISAAIDKNGFNRDKVIACKSHNKENLGNQPSPDLLSCEDDEYMMEKLHLLEKDIEDVGSLLRTLQDNISREKKAQRTLQSAWCARFKIHLNKMQRLEKRYRKVCQYLIDARKYIMKKKPKVEKKKSEENRKLINKESGTTKQNDDTSSVKTIGLLRGRLDAAHIVMNKQKSKLLDFQQEIDNQNNQIQKLKQRLIKSEAQNASKESLTEAQTQQFEVLEKKHKSTADKIYSIKKETDELKHALNHAQLEMVALKNKYDKAIEENDSYAVQLLELKTKAEKEVLQISKDLIEEKDKSKQWELKFNELCKQFSKTIEVASDRITTANKKLREFFKAIEIFLELTHKASKSTAVGLYEAEKIASSILSISQNELHKLTSSVENRPQLNACMKQLKCLIERDSFSEELAYLMFQMISEKSSHCANA